MKKTLFYILSFILVITMLSGCSKTNDFTFCPAEENGDISVVSFNVAAPWGNLLDGTASFARVKRFAAYMNAVKSDFIATQEMNGDWLDKLGDLMPEYDSYGIERGGDENDKKSEMNAVFWLKDKYECVEKNTFWLSETPDEESRYEGAGCNRICSYVMLHDLESDKYILFLNTHLDNASDEARKFGAKVILDKLEEIENYTAVRDYATVIAGDFNDYFESSATKLLSLNYNAAIVDGVTYHDWGNITEGQPIDFIFTSGSVNWQTRLDDTSNGYISDHYGVYASINY